MRNLAIVRKRQWQKQGQRRKRKFNSWFKEPNPDFLGNLDSVKKRLEEAREKFLLYPEIDYAKKYLEAIKRYHHTAIKKIKTANLWNFQNAGLLLNYLERKTSKEKTLELLNPRGRILTFRGAKREFDLLKQQGLFETEIKKIEGEKGFIPDRLRLSYPIKLEDISCYDCWEFARCDGLDCNCYNEKEYSERLKISQIGRDFLEGRLKI